MAMPGFSQILGQATALQTLSGALERGTLHHAYRFEGPPGVGKELTALALAQALLCEKGGVHGCGECKACRRVALDEGSSLPLHPDVVLIAKGLYPPASLGRTAQESSGISVQQIRRLVLSRVGYQPHEGRAQMFIVRDAHELTTSAANALLKVLEEPSPGTYFVLLTHRPRALLDTIRSRTLPVRFAALPSEIVMKLAGVSESVASLAQGSVELALELAQEDTFAERGQFAERALELMEAPDYSSALELADLRAQDRTQLKAQLAFLAQRLAQRARAQISAAPAEAERRARQYQIVMNSIRDVDRNAQGALLVENMIAKLRQA